MKPKTKFDREISLRMTMLGGLTAYLASPKFDLPSEVVTAIGVVAGFIYDAVAFKIKKWWE